MKQIVIYVMLAFTFLMSFSVKAQQLELFDGDGIPTIEATSHENIDLSFLDKLRSEIQADQIKAQARSEADGPVMHATKNVIPENMTFFIAAGGVNFLTMMMKTNSDPALMVKHVESLKDPIALMSFYSFMVANGVYINFKTKGMDPMTKQFAMKSLQYKGMAIGSLASSFTADLLTTFSACSNGWSENKNDAESHAACNEAYKTWTLRNKFTQYAPQILSLIASQAAADGATVVSQAVKGKWTGTAVRAMESKAIKLFKITGATISFFITPGGPVVKTVGWLGKVSQFGMFLAIDHIMTPSLMRIGNNVLQPFFFQFDVNALDRLVKNAADANWSSENAAKQNATCPVQVPNCKNFDKLPSEIENFTYRMQQWRLHLNAKVDNDLNGWMSETNKLLHQIEFSRNFYRSYLENLYSTLKRKEEVKNGNYTDHPERAWGTSTIYPYRTLPLYGVKSGKVYQGEKEEDLYLLKPYFLVEHQKENLKKIAVQFSTDIKKYKLDPISEKKFLKLLTGLQSDSDIELGENLIALNNLVGVYSNLLTQEQAYLTNEHKVALKALRKEIGNPMPVMQKGAGFSQAFITNTSNKLTAQAARFEMSKRYYNFNKPTDLLFYNMICGLESAQISETMMGGINFLPPKLTTSDSSNQILCGTLGTYITTNSIYNLNLKLNDTQVSATDYLISQIDPKILGDFANKGEGSGFSKWWNQSILPVTQAKFKTLDARYQTLVTEAYGNVNEQKSFTDFTIDLYTHWSDRLGTNIYGNLDFELEFYFSTLENILSKNKISTPNYTDSIITKTLQKRLDTFTVDKTLEAKNPLLFAVQKLKKSYKNILSLLNTSSAINFEKIEELNSELSQNSNIIFEKIKTLEAQKNLPAEIKSLLSIQKGLESLEIDAKRYLFMKVNLANRLEIDTAQMSDFLKGQKNTNTHTGTKIGGK